MNQTNYTSSGFAGFFLVWFVQTAVQHFSRGTKCKVAYPMEEGSTPEPPVEPDDGLVDLRPPLQVLWVPMIRYVVLLDQVAQDGIAADTSKVSDSHPIHTV